jgi:putative IMPACT (imprinted ancient) family translation regulator
MYTLAAPVSHGEEIRKSRFQVVAAPVASAESAMAFLASRTDPLATHNCWAYRVGQAYRFNDDGEPGGTAGKPILQAIDGLQCDRVAVLVIRHFGGIKLGAGGLMRAYGGSAARALRLGELVPIVETVDIACRCAFADMAHVKAVLARGGAEWLEETYTGDGVILLLRLAKTDEAALRLAVADLTRGQAGWCITPPRRTH